jgi:hypothetical protein
LGLLKALDKHPLLLMPRLAKANGVIEPYDGLTTGHGGLVPDARKVGD